MDFVWLWCVIVGSSLVKKISHSGECYDNREGYACVGEVGIREISVPPSQFCCKSKTALKKSLIKKMILGNGLVNQGIVERMVIFKNLLYEAVPCT